LDRRTIFDPYDLPEEQVKRLLIQLSERIPKLGHLIAKEQLREKQISPVYGKDGHVRLFSASKPFYIIDREYLNHSFRGKVNVLDIDHNTFWLLEPFFIWIGFQSRFHKNIFIVEPASLAPGSVNWVATPVMDPGEYGR